MLRKEITYTTLNGEKVTDICYFNMTKAEIAAMQVKMDGKFIDYLKDLVAGNHVEALFNIFRDIVLDSYGERSADGKRFVKGPDKRAEFEYSLAFSELFVDLIQNSEKMSAFTRAILPADMVKAGDLDAASVPAIS